MTPWISACKETTTTFNSFNPEKAALKAATLEERPATIHSKPKITDKYGGTWLEPSEGGTYLSHPWADQGQSTPVELDPNKTYQFDLLEQPYVVDPDLHSGQEFEWSASLVKILDSGQVIYDASICALHKAPMKRETVPISYGLLVYPEGFRAAMKTKFPNATPYIEGGCSVGFDRTQRVFRCEQCIREQQAWDAAHPQSR